MASAITTSGPSHVGTMCEFLCLSALVKYLTNEGHRIDFIFQEDIMDAFAWQRIRWFLLSLSTDRRHWREDCLENEMIAH